MLASRGKAVRRIAATVALAGGLVGVTALPAHANLVTGECTFKVDISFPSTSPGVGVNWSPYKIDLVGGTSSCTFPAFGSTQVGQLHASAGLEFGGTSLSKCGVLAGIGQWNESWVDGGMMAKVDGGTHVLAGTWLQATIVAQGSPIGMFQSVIQLLPDPDNPAAIPSAIATCATGGAVSSIRMLAVQVANDPTL